jgi:glyoxylase-like metal-dependent hydrolase (beta-lactamase superfamily II)
MPTTPPDPSPWDAIAQCALCGVEQPADRLPAVCPICADERQWLSPDGVQRWTTPRQSREEGARLEIVDVEPDVRGIVLTGGSGIHQQAMLVSTPGGNVMIEVPAHIDDDIVARVRELGGLRAIIASHPHMYGVQSLWSAAFDDAPVHVSEVDAGWLGVRPTATVTWTDEIELAPGMVASQPGGHFPGSVVVRWAAPDGKGVLFCGDTVFPGPDRARVSFLRSYPNRIPLSAAVVRRVADHVARHDFDRMYGNFGNPVLSDARGAVLRSADQYIRWVSGDYDHLT